ncbi:hypothetical protein POM88_038325 [Heracleum sosnowskyi]|uniref:Uncharacterized protein n=1 Tax=Heracleum sosnowskyi TaxID=360622 RepID=A0AAD8M7Q2_9APIA|nr:hypothetical protein POM88_038325 [Heracleum sosnowskyi]
MMFMLRVVAVEAFGKDKESCIPTNVLERTTSFLGLFVTSGRDEFGEVTNHQAFKLLRASLSSTSVLTNVLKHLILEKPKRRNNTGKAETRSLKLPEEQDDETLKFQVLRPEI